MDNEYLENEINIIFDECSFDIENYLFENFNKIKNSDIITDISSDSDELMSDESDIINEQRFNCSEINEKNIEFNHLKQYFICEKNN